MNLILFKLFNLILFKLFWKNIDFILDSYVSSYLDIDLRFGDSRMLRFSFEQVFDKRNQFNHNK